MSHRDAGAICRKIDAALDFMGDDEEQLRPYLLYQLEEIMGGRRHINMEDCATPELMALLAVTLPIFARGLAGITGIAAPPGKLLTLIIGDVPADDSSSTGA